MFHFPSCKESFTSKLKGLGRAQRRKLPEVLLDEPRLGDSAQDNSIRFNDQAKCGEHLALLSLVGGNQNLSQPWSSRKMRKILLLLLIKTRLKTTKLYFPRSSNINLPHLISVMESRFNLFPGLKTDYWLKFQFYRVFILEWCWWYQQHLYLGHNLHKLNSRVLILNHDWLSMEAAPNLTSGTKSINQM